jgi:AraC-like DNA-binding protein
MAQFETDPAGGLWYLVPHDLRNGSVEGFFTAFRALQLPASKRARLMGMRLKLPPGQGSGNIDVVILDNDAVIMIFDAEYHEDDLIHVPGDRMAKVRILLAGGLERAEEGIRLSGTGAFLEAYPGTKASEYVLKGGGPLKVVILCCGPSFYTDALQIAPDELPFPISHLFGPEDAEPKSGVAPLGPDVLRAANDILRASTRFEPVVRRPYLTSKVRELSCVMLADLKSARDAAGTSVPFAVRDVSRATEARDLLLDEFQRPPSIPQLARRVGLNQTKLKLVFKAMFGVTIHEFTQRCRMDRAVELLTSSDLSVAEISYAVGYDYPASFTHAFRKFYGHAPRQTRRAAGQNHPEDQGL